MSETYECIDCLDDIHDGSAIVLNDYHVCVTCFESKLKPMFNQALIDESSYPVRWSGQEVVLTDSIRGHFYGSFLAKWSAIQTERSVLPKNRHYCAGPQCGRFLGAISTEQNVKECTDCSSRSCGVCAVLVTGLTEDHRCATIPKADEAFEGITRGVDYQICPKCTTPVSIKDGCNHMTCGVPACRSGFCYICGKEAKEGSGHWNIGNPCPRYNSRGASNAAHDHETVQIDRPRGIRHVIWNRAEDALNAANPELWEAIQTDEEAAAERGYLRELAAEDIQGAFDRISNLSESRLAREDAAELLHVIDEIREYAVSLWDDGQALPLWLNNTMQLAHYLLTGTDVYAAPLITVMHRPMGEDFKRFFIEEWDPAIQDVYHASGEGLIRWPQVDDVYYHYRLAVDNRMAELVDFAPPAA
ncbi:hypothetical protein CLAFUW4_04417 [Fulvia fulva]|uniref:RING-type domain-containing protein n=1 Tax=Passalora fulva TaxID=5499 RepID=A0A9Q8LFI5_PASFU|nr:uncharacterized protein CLAFUR5_04380 [Fulvia fulva]KAK4627167.1 hypothetical protein CLAFUR4_04403 [Fulvia fulva]KAK4628285.1 hypothetical protein CLAFUR0_04405 [Fulvia fulva]UJO16507.1 hypothetical protein CLAFUR5_04380 [Fulvia fulva]WPV14194.1 hypothetical protein CLAFUW4_04417 [Fulvia fulva]WPV28056.1 hypothetical protein CLAFUW7_04407 [Fulvia fulva]